MQCSVPGSESYDGDDGTVLNRFLMQAWRIFGIASIGGVVRSQRLLAGRRSGLADGPCRRRTVGPLSANAGVRRCSCTSYGCRTLVLW
jgi:hypothetical protein